MVTYELNFEIDDLVLSSLHSAAFGQANSVSPWQANLARHSVCWVGASEQEMLVGFVHASGDGGRHAFVLDTVVHPERQGQGIGSELVERLALAVRDLGCEWLHVDYEDHLAEFYRLACGFSHTAAGLRRL